jgi:branched-chain amino acid aminotransferase
MGEIVGDHLILNGDLIQAEEFNDNLICTGESVYEVIRMVNGIPLFFNDHMERLSASLKLQGKNHLADPGKMKTDIIKLSDAVFIKENNIRIVFNYSVYSNNYLIHHIRSSYPSEHDYNSGVKGILFDGERKDPEAKVIDNEFRFMIAKALKDENAYEAILVNRAGLITEGSKSNIFFIHDDILYTAPDHLILKGITRRHILNICNDERIRVEYMCIDAKRIGEYDSVFMTGTSPAVLPFCCISGNIFRSDHPLTGKLRELYVEKAVESMNEFENLKI